MATLSPFRYIQVCRYILQRYLIDRRSRHSPAKWKGKARQALHQLQSQSGPSLAMASAAHNRHHDHHDNGAHEHTPDEPIAGPSTRPLPPNERLSRSPLKPDPDEPPEPREIYRLMNDERLLIPGAVKPPRETVVLCHGES